MIRSVNPVVVGNSRRSLSSSAAVVNGGDTTITNSNKTSSNNSKTSHIEPTVPAKYFVPRKERSGGFNDLYTFSNTPDERLARSHRRSPTRELNFTTTHWEQHKSVHRRTRHMRTFFQSSALQRLAFPDLFLTATTAIGLTYYNTEIATDYASQILMDGSVMAGGTTAIGLLAAFRLNASYGRYDEGRKFWGEINNACRDLAGNAMMWLETKEQKDRMLNYIKAFPIIMQFHLHHKGGHHLMRESDPTFHDQVYAEFYTEIKDIYDDPQDPDFVEICETFQDKKHGPLTVVSKMRRIIAENGTWVSPIYNKEMDEQIRRLVGCMGMCERVLRTPIPSCFTRHTSRLFFVWSNALPFAMYGACGPLGTLPAALMVSYAVLGIEDIGVQLEEPFNILPLRQYADGIYAGVDSIRDGYLLLGESFSPADLGMTASPISLDGLDGTTTTTSAATFVDEVGTLTDSELEQILASETDTLQTAEEEDSSDEEEEDNESATSSDFGQRVAAMN